MEENKQKALKERESQLVAKLDASSLTEEGRKQVLMYISSHVLRLSA